MADFPGHGEASGDGERSVGAYTRHLFNLVRSLPGDMYCLVGHSLGGAIVQKFALKYSQYVEALILVGTGARLRVLPQILEGLLGRFEETVRLINDYAFSKRGSGELIHQGVEAMLKTSGAVLYGDFSACNQFDIMERVSDIHAPTLVVCGSDDLLTPPKYAHYLAEKIKGARLEIISGAGHMVMVEKPDEFNMRVLKFLQGLPDRTNTNRD